MACVVSIINLTKWPCILEFLFLELFVADKAHASTCEWFIWTSVWIYDCPSFSAICGLGQDWGNSPVLVSNGVTEVLHWVCNLFSPAEPHTVRWEILQWRCCASKQIIPQVCLHYTYTHCQPWPTDTQQEWGWWTVYVQRDWLDPWHAAQGHQRRQYECSVGFFYRQQAYQASSHEVCYSILNGLASLSLPYRQQQQWLVWTIWTSLSAVREKAVNTLRPRQNGRLFPDNVFKCIFLDESVWFAIKISLQFVFKVWINNIPALVQIMAWCQPGDKPLSEPMLARLLTHISYMSLGLNDLNLITQLIPILATEYSRQTRPIPCLPMSWRLSH